MVVTAALPEKVPIVSVEGRVIYALQPKQYEVFCKTPVARYHLDGRLRQPTDHYPQHLGYGGAGGGGKSYCSRALLAAVALTWPGSTAILFRKTEREVKENHVEKFRTEFPDVINGNRWYTFNGQDLLFRWENGSRTLFGYLRHNDDVYTYQGPEYDVMIFEESTHYTDFQIEWLSGNRLRSTVPGTQPFAFYPSNPGNRGHGRYKRLFINRQYRLDQGEYPENYDFVQAKLTDNAELMRRDPGYQKRLDLLPEPWRSWQRDGDFSAGVGMALTQIDRRIHMVKPFQIPAHWVWFGAFDWGYEHPWVFGLYVVNEDGKIFKVDTFTGRRMLPHEIAQRVAHRMGFDPMKLKWIHAGHDVKAERRALGENVPTVQETFQQHGFILGLANIDRVQGLQQLRLRLQPNDVHDAQLVFFDTEGNRKCLECLENMVTDPNDVEDVLKVDADEHGEGGDDSYDETRYAVCSRPIQARSLYRDQPVEAWSTATLQAEYERTHRHRTDLRAKTSSAEDYEDPLYSEGM